MKKVAIIGGGILGLAIGYKLSVTNPKFKVAIFEKEGNRPAVTPRGFILSWYSMGA